MRRWKWRFVSWFIERVDMDDKVCGMVMAFVGTWEHFVEEYKAHIRHELREQQATRFIYDSVTETRLSGLKEQELFTAPLPPTTP